MGQVRGLSLYAFFVFLLFLVSMQLWIGWGHKAVLMSICGIFTIICGYSCNMYKFSKKYVIAVLILYVSYLFVSIGITSRTIFSQIPSFLIPIICVLCVRDAYKKQILMLITKWYAIILIPSVIIYFINNIVHLPSLGIIYHDNLKYGGFENYLFYVHAINGSGRFNGPFLEPGHLGMIGAFILMANNFRLKNRYNIIIAVSIVLSLSLAGYMLALIGYILCAYNEGKKNAGKLIIFAAFVVAFVLVAQNYNGGDNIINEKILSRFESDEEKGIAGNNRASFHVMILFEDALNDNNLLLYGYDREYQRQNAELFTSSNGLVFFIVQHGLVGVFVVFLFYIFLAIKAKNRKYALSFLLFVFLCFLQRSYYNWIPWILCFDYAIANNDILKKTKLLRKIV